MSGTVESDAADSLFAASVADDPHPAYRRIRQECPVARTQMGDRAVVIVSRYEDVCWALRHPEYFTSAGGSLKLGEQPLIPARIRSTPAHQVPALAESPIRSREIQLLEPEVRRIVRGLIDNVAPRGKCDFNEEDRRRPCRRGSS